MDNLTKPEPISEAFALELRIFGELILDGNGSITDMRSAWHLAKCKAEAESIKDKLARDIVTGMDNLELASKRDIAVGTAIQEFVRVARADS